MTKFLQALFLVAVVVLLIDLSFAKIPGERSCNGQGGGQPGGVLPVASNPIAVAVPAGPVATSSVPVPSVIGQVATLPAALNQGIDVRSPGAETIDAELFGATGSMSMPPITED